jgi:hypothetical protein
LSQVHAHIFIAGTIENSIGERESHRVNREQVVADGRSRQRDDNLHSIAHEQMEQMLDRTIGLEWRELRPPDPEPTPEVQQTIWDDLMADVTTDTPQPEMTPSIQEPSPGLDLEL